MIALKNGIKNYCEQTSVHGFSYLASSSSLLAKLIWSCVIITGFITAGIMIHNAFQDWSDNPVITTLDSITVPIREIQFPTVTVCPYSPNMKPNHWSYPQYILNSLSFECYQNDTSYPDCNDTLKVRQDFQVLTSGLFQHLLDLIESNGNKGLSGQFVRPEKLLIKATCLYIYGKLPGSKLRSLFNEHFGKGTDVWTLLENAVNISSVSSCLLPHYKAREIPNRFLEAGKVFLDTNQNMPLGNLVKDFSSVVEERTLTRGAKKDVVNVCDNLTSFDMFIQSYFTELSQNVFGLNVSHSLFDIPTMLGDFDKTFTLHDILGNKWMIYSYCMLSSFERNKLRSCMSKWRDYLSDQGQQHPCSENNSDCCSFWTSSMELEAVMRIMRVSSHSATNFIDLNGIFDKATSLDVRYNQNPIGIGYYKQDSWFDQASFIRECHYGRQRSDQVEQACSLLQPVLTDTGICYGFNTKDPRVHLVNSSFKKDFLSAYQTEFNEQSPQENTHMGKGTNPDLGLTLLLDNNEVLEGWNNRYSFKVGIGSQDHVIDMREAGRKVLPGMRVDFEVHPVEVKGTSKLKKMPIETRKCRFPDETEGMVHIFKSYSASDCNFECKLKHAKEFCGCTPWNYPRFPGNVNVLDEPVCDLFGNQCFQEALQERHHHSKCHCHLSCDDLKFTVTKSETALKPEDLCKYPHQVGRRLLELKLKHTYNGLRDQYGNLVKRARGINDTAESDNAYEQCSYMIKYDLAIVSVNFGSTTYVRTTKDIRVTFTDQLGSLGGTLGLFTGMSLLSVFELFYWIIKGHVVLFKRI